MTWFHTWFYRTRLPEHPPRYELFLTLVLSLLLWITPIVILRDPLSLGVTVMLMLMGASSLLRFVEWLYRQTDPHRLRLRYTTTFAFALCTAYTATALYTGNAYPDYSWLSAGVDLSLALSFLFCFRARPPKKG